MFFCERCGYKLASDAHFCENCGYSVAYDEASPNIGHIDEVRSHFFLFENANWRTAWTDETAKATAQKELIGIALINTYGDDANDESFKKTLSAYLDFKSKNHVHYFVLDLYNQSVSDREYNGNISDVIDIVKTIYSASEFDYLMIIGDWKTIPNIRWKNETGDHDDYVDSDLPYMSLNVSSPFERNDHRSKLAVGRIPCNVHNHFLHAQTYFSNMMQTESHEQKKNLLAITAESWEETTKTIISATKNDLIASPDKNGVFEITFPTDDYDYLLFNLHGSDATHFWYGEAITDHAKKAAISIKNLPRNDGYVVFSEACYGARPLQGLANRESILTQALANGCKTFVGSTQIAYGCGGGSVSCADVIAKSFSESVILKDFSVGMAMRKAINDSISRNGEANDAEIKTIAEFALYGDPSVKFNGRTHNEKTADGSYSAYKNDQKSLHVSMPDIRRIVNIKIDEISERIEHLLNAYVNKKHPELKNVKPQYYQQQGTKNYQALYMSDRQEIKSVVKIYFNENGTIQKEYISK